MWAVGEEGSIAQRLFEQSVAQSSLGDRIQCQALPLGASSDDQLAAGALKRVLHDHGSRIEAVRLSDPFTTKAVARVLSSHVGAEENEQEFEPFLIYWEISRRWSRRLPLVQLRGMLARSAWGKTYCAYIPAAQGADLTAAWTLLEEEGKLSHRRSITARAVLLIRKCQGSAECELP